MKHDNDTTIYANDDGTVSEVRSLGKVKFKGRMVNVELETVHGTPEQIANVLHDMEKEQ